MAGFLGPAHHSLADITGQVALLILFDSFAWLKDAGSAGVVGGKPNIQWVEFVLERSDEYWESQVAIAANRFPKKF